MSLLDKVIAAVTPPESDEARAEARAKARAAAGAGSDWLSQVLDHHEQIEQAFEAVKSSTSVTGRKAAQKWLVTLLTGHSIAEEAVLYPVMALDDLKTHSATAYLEQSATKVQLAALDELEPMSQDYLDKLEHIRGAVAHHVYEEEGDYFPELREKANTGMQSKMTRRYKEEFERYMGSTTK